MPTKNALLVLYFILAIILPVLSQDYTSKVQNIKAEDGLLNRITSDIVPDKDGFLSPDYLFEAKLLTTEDGLANLSTSSVHKDKNGYLWIGTNGGLNRYDGYNFTYYTQEKNNLHSNSPIHQIKEDAAGNLWLYYFSEKGHLPTSLDKIEAIDIFNPQTGKAIPIDVFFENKVPFSVKNLSNIRIIDTENRIWLATKSGELYLFQNGQFLKIYEQENTAIQYLTVDNKDNIWLGWGKTITKINLDGVLQETQHLPNYVLGIWVNDTEQLWWTTGDWVAEYGNNKPIDKSKKFNTRIWSKKKQGTAFQLTLNKGEEAITLDFLGTFFLHRSKAGHWYAQIENQLNIFDRDGQFIYNYHDLIGKDLRVGYNNYFEAANNEFWLPTSLGLVKTKININPFKLIYGKEESTDYRGITEAENGTIFFQNIGVYQFNPKSAELPKKKTLDGYFALIYTDSMIWSGTYAQGIVGIQLDLRTQEIDIYKKADNLSHLLSYATLKTTLPSEYLIGTDNGLCYLNIQQKKIRPFTQYNGFDILKHSEIYHLHKNDRGIWLATNNGVFLMDEKEGIIQKYDMASKDLPFNFIRHIYETEEGIFWLATKGGGVIQWKPAPTKGQISTYQQFTIKDDGLSHNATYAIYGDDYGKLWIPSDKGLMCMDAKTYEVNIFLKEDGLPHNEFNLTAHYRAKDGTLYFGGLGGLISFHPKFFEDRFGNNHPLKFVKYQVLEEGAAKETDRTADLMAATNITLEPTDKFLQLQFTLLDFDDPSQHSYAYQIEGYSNQWTYIEENYIRITSLPYGNYRLRVKGRNLGSGWSEQELSLGIKVKKPFYLQWWFIIAMIALGMASLYTAVKWRIALLKKDKERLEAEVKKRTQQIEEDKEIITAQAEALKQLDKAKTRFFSNITHEFRTPLTLVIGPIQQLLKASKETSTRKKLTNVLTNAQSILRLINQLLDISKLEGGKMKVEVTRGNIVTYTQELTQRFQLLATKKEQQLVFVAKQTSWKTHFDKNKWDKIIYNLVFNAIKFTPHGGTIQVNLSKTEKQNSEWIYLKVSDTGIGIANNQLNNIFNRFYQADDTTTRLQEGTGIGLSLVKELVELQGGAIEVTSKVDKGTTFDIKLPLLSAAKFSDEPTPVAMGLGTLPLLKQTELSSNSMEAISNNKEKLKLLLIEDNKEMRAYIRSCIDSNKYTISEAVNGVEGIQKAQELIPDLIISDLMMPLKDGFAVTESVRTTTSTSHIPIILLTAKAALESRLEGLQRGADVYLTKPFSPEELVLRIQKLIEIRQLMQARYQSATSTLSPLKQVQAFKKEDVFIIKLRKFINENISEASLNGDFIGKNFKMSRMQLHRKLKALTNQTTSEYIQSIRLERAHEFLQQKEMNVSEIAYETGFSSPSYFSQAFRKKYGQSPSSFLS